MEHIKKIHNAIFVSDKIITYKTAAAILAINANEVKLILKEFVNDLKNKKESLNVSYVLGGITSSNTHKIVIVSQNKYEKIKSQFKTITIDHIYSVQKSPLVDWTAVFNIDDLLYDKKTSDVNIKQEEVDEIKTETQDKETVKPTQSVSKKGSISNFFSQTNTNNQKKNVKKDSENANQNTKSKKPDKPTILSNFINKSSNKENSLKVANSATVKKEAEEIEDEDEEIFKTTKKRSRVINDDEDDDTPVKCAKVDILDDPMEEGPEEYHSDEDIFGSPEKDETLMNESEEMFSSETTEKETENSAPSTVTENSENMYEDDEGYFVTEKNTSLRNKTKKQEPEKQMTKKEIKVKTKIEKAAKKEVVQKLKNNTNQKSILSFFQKK